jgi:hypothetical protein
MKKIILIIAVLGSITHHCFAQTTGGAKLSIGFEPGLAVGDYRNIHAATMGASLKYGIPVADKTSFTLSVGITSFLYRNHLIGTTKTNDNFIPLLAGLKDYVNGGVYLEGQIGAAISTEKHGGAGFAYSSVIGYQFSKHFDLSTFYKSWAIHDEKINEVALRAGFSF